MQLTDEQRAVIESNEPILKINAVAGSGKTTTLMEYAERRRDKRILYLAYNKSVADEMRARAAAKFLSNVRVNTIHGLAYRYAKGSQYNLTGELSEWEILDRYVPPQERQSKDALLFAWLLKELVNFYLNSEHRGLDEALLRLYEEHSAPKARIRELLAGNDAELLGIVKNILSDMRGKAIPAVHDFYLKMFQFSKETLGYDIILVDEAQDTSGVMISIVNRQPADKVFVGDTFQQIYAFRYAINSLATVSAPSYLLTQTFRFDDGLAKHLAEKINSAYAILDENKTIRIKGTSDYTLFGKQALDKPRPLAIISRSNLGLFDACLRHLSEGNSRFYFEGGYKGYSFMNGRVLSVFYLSEGIKGKVNDPLVRRFKSLSELKAFAADTQNKTLGTIIDLVSRYGAKIFDFDRRIKERLTDKAHADIIFTTTHKAKGQEYDHVEMLEDDFVTRADLRKAVKNGEDDLPVAKLREEINVYYVAATRARKSIRLAYF